MQIELLSSLINFLSHLLLCDQSDQIGTMLFVSVDSSWPSKSKHGVEQRQ